MAAAKQKFEAKIKGYQLSQSLPSANHA